jgi:hypothetical protein
MGKIRPEGPGRCQRRRKRKGKMQYLRKCLDGSTYHPERDYLCGRMPQGFILGPIGERFRV